MIFPLGALKESDTGSLRFHLEEINFKFPKKLRFLKLSLITLSCIDIGVVLSILGKFVSKFLKFSPPALPKLR